MKASLKNYHQSPRKVRLVADLVRGKRVDRALSSLAFLTKSAALPIKSVIEAAVSSAGSDARQRLDHYFVKEIRVDEGVTLKRHMPRARGSAFPIRKRLSHISISLADNNREQILRQAQDPEFNRGTNNNLQQVESEENKEVDSIRR